MNNIILQTLDNNILSQANKADVGNKELGDQAKAGSLFADKLKQCLGGNAIDGNSENLIPEVTLGKLAFEKPPISFDGKSKDSIEKISIEQATLIKLTPTNDGFEPNLNPPKNNETAQKEDVTNTRIEPSDIVLPTPQIYLDRMTGLANQLNNIIVKDHSDVSIENDIGDGKLKLEPIFNADNSAISKETDKLLNISSELIDKEREIIPNLSVDDIKPKTDNIKYYVGFRSSTQPTLNADLVAKFTENKPKEEFEEKTVIKLAIDEQVGQAVSIQNDQNIINYSLISQPEQVIGREYVSNPVINGRQETETAKINNVLPIFDQKIQSTKNQTAFQINKESDQPNFTVKNEFLQFNNDRPERNTLPYNMTDNLIKNETKVESNDETVGIKMAENPNINSTRKSPAITGHIDNMEYTLFNENNVSERPGSISMNTKQINPSKIIFESNSQQNIERSSADKMPTLNTQNIETFKELNISSISYIKSDAIQNNNEYKGLNGELISQKMSESQQIVNYEPIKTKTQRDMTSSQLEYEKLANYQQNDQALEKANQIQSKAGNIGGLEEKTAKLTINPQNTPIIEKNNPSNRIISTDQQTTDNADGQDQSSGSETEYSLFGKPSFEAERFNKNTQSMMSAEDISNSRLGYEKAIFIKENGQKVGKESENIITNNEEDEFQPVATLGKMDLLPQKMEIDPIFSIPKAENATIQKNVEIISKALELPEKITEYINMMKAYNDAKPHSVVIQLDPPNLGKIRLKVSMKDDRVIAEINVANFMTKEVLEAQMPEIKRNLLQYDIQISGFNVTLDNGNSKSNYQNPNSSQQDKWSTQSWLYDRNNEQKNREDNKRRYMRYTNNDSLVDLLT